MNRMTARVRVLITAAVTGGVLTFGATTALASSRSARDCMTEYPGHGVCISQAICYEECFAINQGGGYCSGDVCCICEY